MLIKLYKPKLVIQVYLLQIRNKKKKRLYNNKHLLHSKSLKVRKIKRNQRKSKIKILLKHLNQNKIN